MLRRSWFCDSLSFPGTDSTLALGINPIVATFAFSKPPPSSDPSSRFGQVCCFPAQLNQFLTLGKSSLAHEGGRLSRVEQTAYLARMCMANPLLDQGLRGQPISGVMGRASRCCSLPTPLPRRDRGHATCHDWRKAKCRPLGAWGQDVQGV